jgi:hypothetical protein
MHVLALLPCLLCSRIIDGRVTSLPKDDEFRIHSWSAFLELCKVGLCCWLCSFLTSAHLSRSRLLRLYHFGSVVSYLSEQGTPGWSKAHHSNE